MLASATSVQQASFGRLCVVRRGGLQVAIRVIRLQELLSRLFVLACGPEHDAQAKSLDNKNRRGALCESYTSGVLLQRDPQHTLGSN